MVSLANKLADTFASEIGKAYGMTMLQEKEEPRWMTNEVVIFFNTLIGVAAAMAIGMLTLGM